MGTDMYLTKADFPIDVDHQSIEIPNSGGARQSTLSPIGATCDSLFKDAKTIVEAIQRGYRLSNDGPCFGWRDSDSDYKWLSYSDVIQRSRHISCGLIASGIERGQETFVGIFAQNCVEWTLVEHACYTQSMVTVPLYETLGPDAIKFVINHVEAKVVVCDTEKKVKSILDVCDKLPSLKQIITMKDIGEDVKIFAMEKGIQLQTLDKIEELGRGQQGYLKLPMPSDLATICYTSVTTGNPKGVMITHRNFVADASAYIHHMGLDRIVVGDKYISFLPLAHMIERLAHVVLYCCGACIGFFRGDIKLLNEDMNCLKPTILATVPRVLNKIFDKVQSEVNSSFIKKYLLNTALRAKQAELERGIIRNNSIWDYLILKNIRNALGGELRMVITGGAPIRDDVLLFFRCCLGCPLLQAYGQTETTATICSSAVGDYSGGTTGPPLPCCFVKLIDVPQMNYFAQDGKGEILVKGTNVTKGYYKDPDPLKTAEILDSEGWLHTGDVGYWMKNGALAVIDRKKNILKLSQGEFVSPEKVEGVYQASPYVEQIFVHGNSLENYLVAIVVPDKEALLSWCCSQSNVKGDWEEICQNKVVIEHVLKHLYQLGQEAGLNSIEQVKAIYLQPEVFTQENGILKATMKIKRIECQKRFKDVIEYMYKST